MMVSEQHKIQSGSFQVPPIWLRSCWSNKRKASIVQLAGPVVPVSSVYLPLSLFIIPTIVNSSFHLNTKPLEPSQSSFIHTLTLFPFPYICNGEAPLFLISRRASKRERELLTVASFYSIQSVLLLTFERIGSKRSSPLNAQYLNGNMNRIMHLFELQKLA